MNSTNLSFNNIAVLIDGDNINAKNIESILAKVSTLGTIACKRIYGDFKQGKLTTWDDISLKLLLEQMHIPAYVKGKNATDIALAIDAVDLSYLDYDCFCIISSDSDFSILAKNLRTKGKKVFGFGKSTTVESFKVACDDYFVMDDTIPPEPSNSATKPTPSQQLTDTSFTQKLAMNESPSEPPIARVMPQQLKQDTALLNACRQSIQHHRQNNSWSNFSKVISHLNSNYPKISPKNYGYSKWRSLFNQIDLFETQMQNNLLMIRQKPSQNKTKNLPTDATTLIQEQKLLDDIYEIFAKPIIKKLLTKNQGWLHIGQFGSELKNKGYNPTQFGVKNFTKLAENIAILKVKRQPSVIMIALRT